MKKLLFQAILGNLSYLIGVFYFFECILREGGGGTLDARKSYLFQTIYFYKIIAEGKFFTVSSCYTHIKGYPKFFSQGDPPPSLLKNYKGCMYIRAFTYI